MTRFAENRRSGRSVRYTVNTYLVINKGLIFDLLYAFGLIVAGVIGCAIGKTADEYLLGIFVIMIGAILAAVLSLFIPAAHRFSESGVEFYYFMGGITVKWSDVRYISERPAVSRAKTEYVLCGPDVKTKNRFTGAFIPKTRKTKMMLEKFYHGRIG